MKAAGKGLELRVYPKTGHAFFNDTRVSYRAEASRDAWARTLALFAHALTPLA
jgi:carboxymethylenebutenolidase